MPWCGIWGAAGSPSWWILPAIGLVFLAIMLLVFFWCFGRFRRVSGCCCRPGHSDGERDAGSGRAT